MKVTRFIVPALACVASCATLAGSLALIRFDSAPGLQANAPSHWPESTWIPKVKHGSKLIVFAHPKCSCTRATLVELARIKPVDTAILFFRPKSQPRWTEGDTWKQASRISGTTVLWDDDGKQAKQFGSPTSGTVLLYSAEGKLLFQGGITASRGHVGESTGSVELAETIRTGLPASLTTPVFGCGIFGTEYFFRAPSLGAAI